MTKATARERLQNVYTSITNSIDRYADYIDNPEQWRNAVALNDMYEAKAKKIQTLLYTIDTLTGNEDIEINTMEQVEKRWFGKNVYAFMKYELVVDGKVILQV